MPTSPDDATTVNSILFVYDEAGYLLGEYDGTGAVIQETVWLGDLPVGVLKPGALYNVNPDHLGAPLTVTDATGQIVWRWDSDPYGNGKPNENPSGLGTFTYNLRFPGQYYDKETELHYNYFRDYNPKMGRYVQVDPIGLAGGVNLYGYVYANPVGYADRYGANPIIFGEIGAEIGTLFTTGLGTVVGAIVGGVGGYLITTKAVDYILNSEDKDASTPTGQRGSPIDVAPGTNDSCNIGGRDYTGLDWPRVFLDTNLAV